MDDVLDAFDRRLDPLVPTGPAPVTDLVRRGRARRTRRRGLQAGLAAAVVVVATATTTAVVQGRGAAPPPATPAASTPPPSPALTDDVRTIGLDGIVVDIPGDWVANEGCAGEGGLAFAQPGASCSSSLQVGLAPTEQPERAGGSKERRGDLVVRVLRGPGSDEPGECGPNDSCSGFAISTELVIDERVLLVIAAPPGYEAVEEAIDASVRRLPEASVVVPDVAAQTVDGALRTLTTAGLTPVRPDRRMAVLGSSPEAGSVVASGSKVLLSGPALEGVRAEGARIGIRRVELGGVSVAVPEDWVSCPISSGIAFGAPDASGGCASPDESPGVVNLVRVPGLTEDATAVEQGGLRVVVEDGCGPTASCVNPVNRTVTSVDQRVRVVVGAASSDLVETVAASVRAAD